MPLYNPSSGGGGAVADGSITSAKIADGTIAPADESTQAAAGRNLYLAANYQ